MTGFLQALVAHFRLDFWAGVGFAGQMLFSARFIVQWIASERRRESVIPVAFWYLSLAGGAVCLVYSIAIGSLPFMLGQAGGLAVYARNLHLIRRPKNPAGERAG